MMEFAFGGLAACGAGFFTNPLEVVKTRMQLQGELEAAGHYKRHYKNVFHGFYQIAKHEGVYGLQKGLVPALWYQMVMNGIRLGMYQSLVNYGLTKDENGNINFFKSVLAGAISGSMGAFCASPLYMVKTHLQSMANKEIAVGYQHSAKTLKSGLQHVFNKNGVFGLWRGVTAAVSRVAVGSSIQLSTFSSSKELIEKTGIFHSKSIFNPFFASMISGVGVVIFMTPLDVVSTRIYNQNTGKNGVGVYYKGTFDCFVKILKYEGIWGFYKGWAASYFRLGPHTVLSLVFWDQLRQLKR